MPRDIPRLSSTDNPPQHVFLSVVRRGAATQIQSAADTDGRVRVAVQLTFHREVEGAVATPGGPPPDPMASVSIPLLGAGDVTGLDARAVSRVWPRPDVTDAENTYFPLIEFSEIDLPWRYSPAPVTGDRLTPWLALLVLEDGEFTPHPVDGDHPLPTILVNAGVPLPRLEDTWAWAHVHLTPDAAPTSPTADLSDPSVDVVRERLQQYPECAVARLLAPRRLKERTSYTAVLVPTYERGRKAGLGHPDDHIGALAPAWVSSAPTGALADPLELPVYHQWRFGTGAGEDFATLAGRLQPRDLPDGFGRRPVDVQLEDLRALGAPAASANPALLEGALRPWVRFAAEPWSVPWNIQGSTEFHRWFRTLTTPDLNEAVLAPPLYGEWYAARHTLVGALTDTPAWFDGLNADPRTRIAAGAGTEVIQTLQQSLLAGAWQQAAGLQRANETMRFTQLGRETSKSLHARDLQSADDHDTFFRLTAPVLSNVLDGDRTVRARIAQSPIPLGVFQGTWRRLARPRGPARRRSRSLRAAGTTNFLADLNAGRIAAARPPVRPEGLNTPTAMVASLGSSAPSLYDRNTALLRGMSSVDGAASFVEMLLAAATGLTPSDADWLSPSWRRVRDGVQRGSTTRNPNALAEVLRDGPALPGFQVIPMPGEKHKQKPTQQPGSGGGDVASELRRAFGDLGQRLSKNVPREPARTPVDLDRLHQLVEQALDPEETFTRAIQAKLRLAPGIVRRGDPLDPIMVAPVFPQPMVDPLRERSQEWILPGLDKVPQDTLVLLLTNRPFVEAYMVGLNHEMGRELLWHEFPTDQRGTYFRQFWRSSRRADAGALPDIDPIDEWYSTPLGQHAAGTGSDRLVLLLRSELLRRYPSAKVFAVSRAPSAPEQEYQPVFAGTLDPDVTYVGFDIGRAQFEASPLGTWFFVIQQQPTEPLFGAEQPEDPSDANRRGYFMLTGPRSIADLSAIKDSSQDGRRPDRPEDVGDGLKSSLLARWLFRHPVRVEISADALLRQMRAGGTT